MAQLKAQYCSQPRVLVAILAAICGVAVYAMWFGMNSDRDNVHPLLTRLIPAGHCTCQTSTSFQCSDCFSCLSSSNSSSSASSNSAWNYEYSRDSRNLGLSEAQCHAAFPGLSEDIHRAVEYWRKRGGITKNDLENTRLMHGMARVILHNGDLYVVAAQAKGEDHRRKIVATLSAIHRALSASPDPGSIPSIDFIFSVEDRVDDIHANGSPVWVFSRKASEESVWLMPDFGYWAWGHLDNDIGPYTQAVEKILTAESEIPFPEKQTKLVWRGKLSFAPKLRRALLDTARNQRWGDVKELDWGRKANFLFMEDHCRYMFIAHVEGRSCPFLMMLLQNKS